MSNNRVDLHSYLDKGANIIFHISLVIILLGYVLDIIAFIGLSKRLVTINIITVLVVLVVYLLFHLKWVSLKISFGIIIYATIANIFIDTFTDLYLPTRVYFLMRDAIFIIIGLSLTSLVINKIHSIIIAAVYLIFLSVFTVIAKNAFLKDSIYLIILVVSAYAAVVYYFVNVIEKSIATVEEDSRTIKEQNEIVNKSYALLLEHEQRIERQSGELINQSKILQDQSELLQTQNEELNKLVATKDKFFSILAHDLKNPFNTILGFTELLDLKFDKLEDYKKRSYIANIKTTASKTYSLLENLLLWARTQTDRLDYNPQNIAIARLLDAVLQLYRTACTEKRLIVLDNIDEKCLVNADIDLVEIILKNLISNAVKYTSPGGTISIDYRYDGPMAEVSITDSGFGIPEENIDNLFRIDQSRKLPGTNNESGTGLGLIISNELIKKHGGTLSVKSQVGKGSTFSFTLPMAI